MKVIRQIVYEFDDQEDLDRQLGASMPDGTKNIPLHGGWCNSPVKGTVTIRTLYDERVKVDEFPDATAEAVKQFYTPAMIEKIIGADEEIRPTIKDELEAMQESGQS